MLKHILVASPEKVKDIFYYLYISKGFWTAFSRRAVFCDEASVDVLFHLFSLAISIGVICLIDCCPHEGVPFSSEGRSGEVAEVAFFFDQAPLKEELHASQTRGGDERVRFVGDSSRQDFLRKSRSD